MNKCSIFYQLILHALLQGGHIPGKPEIIREPRNIGNIRKILLNSGKFSILISLTHYNWHHELEPILFHHLSLCRGL